MSKESEPVKVRSRPVVESQLIFGN